MQSQMLEIIAGVSLLAGMVILGVVLPIWMRFSARTHARRQVNALDQRRTARRIFWGSFSFGICAAVAGLSLSLWSPAGLERISLGAVLVSFLLLGGGFATIGLVVFLTSCRTARILYDQGQESDQHSGRDC